MNYEQGNTKQKFNTFSFIITWGLFIKYLYIHEGIVINDKLQLPTTYHCRPYS